MEMSRVVIVIAVTFINISLGKGARIIGIFPIPLHSHQIMYRALTTELHSRGHEIVILTTHPIYNKSLINYTEIDFTSAISVWKKIIDFSKTKEHKQSLMHFITDIAYVSKELCKLLFDLQEVKTLLYENERFDLVITGWIIQPCVNGFAYHFSAPLIGISTLGLLYSGHNSIGNPTHPVYFTEIFNAYLKTPTFWQKLDRLVYYIWYTWFWHTTVIPQQDLIARQYFGENMPYLEDLNKNVSLVFTALQTNHYAVVPKVPALIELGAIHIKESKPLPKDLQEYLDGAPVGAIYFSFGTNIRTDKLPEEKKKLFLEIFSQLVEFRIICKWDSEEISNLPSNVKIGKWFPQLDILAHPKIKAFIYQGGLQSTEEAIKFQVPVIGFPFATDQDLNLRRIVDYGAGIKLELNTITKGNLLRALKAVIFNPTYKSNMKRLSDISNDQPQTPMERAVWWTEYVIRHKGATHMRSTTMDLTWFEYLLLDVIAFLIVIFILIIWMAYFFCTYIFRIYVFYSKEKYKFQ